MSLKTVAIRAAFAPLLAIEDHKMKKSAKKQAALDAYIKNYDRNNPKPFSLN